jgi:hypothetical protein
MNWLVFFLSFQVFAVTVINESVGRAGETILTSREVKLSAFVERALSPKTSQQKKSSNLTQDTTALLLEVIVAKEAENFSLGQVAEAESEKAWAEIKKAAGYSALQKELSLSEAEIKTAIKRKLNAQSFIEFKTNSLTSTVTDEEAKIYFEANPNRFKGAQFEGLKENIKTFLSQQQLNERLKSWFELLKRKYKVQNYLLES